MDRAEPERDASVAAERWRRIKELFAGARDVAAAERESFVQSRSSGDRELAEEVLALLSEAERATRFLSTRSLAPELVPQSAPDSIGQYEILGVLGRGGMGVVYLARQRNPRREVALKVMAGVLASPRARRRFEHEADVLARLHHPDIAQVYDAGLAADGTPYFAMERVDGVPLSDWVARERPDVRAKLALFARICDAVQHAHHKGVIHRDLKPANVLVDANGAPKVLDFGIARVAGDGESLARTQPGELVGTLAYMSPEQLLGDDLDTRSDVYALGVMLYELLAGRLPHEIERASIPEAVRAIREDDAPPLSALDARLRGDLETIAAKALEKERERRYASPAELAADVRRHLRDEPIAARPATTFEQLAKFARRNRALVVGTGAVVLVLVLGLIGTTSQWARARTIAAKEHQQRIATERANERAQRRFDQVRELAHKVIYDFHGWIERLPGSTAAREYVVKTGLEYLDGLASEVGDDPELMRELVLGYLKVAVVQGSSNGPSLGDLPGALANCDRALEWARKFEALAPQDPAARICVADVLDIRGDMLLDGDRIDEAVAGWTEGLEIRRGLACAPEGQLRTEHGVITTLMRLSSACSVRGEFARALEFDREALARAQALHQAHPEADLARNDLTIAHGQVGERLDRLGRTEEALTHLQAAFELSRRFAEQHPDDVFAARDVWSGHMSLAMALISLGRDEEALEHASRALSIAQRQVDADPVDVSARYELVRTHEGLGDVHFTIAERADRALEAQSGAWRAARGSYGRALELLGALRDDQTANTLMLNDVGYLESRIGECDEHLAELAEAGG